MSTNNRQYLGDGVYVEYDGYHIVLKTGQPTLPTNTIYLDSQVINALVSYIERLKDSSSDEQE